MEEVKQSTNKNLAASHSINYSELIDGLPNAIYTCDAQGYIQLYNKAAIELWGKRPQINKDKWCGFYKRFTIDGDILHPENLSIARLLQNEIIEKNEEIISEQPNGQRRNIIFYPNLLHDALGNITGAVITLIDASDAAQSKKAAKHRKDYLQLTLQASEMGTFEWNVDSGSFKYSDKLIELFGFKKSQTLTHEDFINSIYPEDTQNRKDAFAEAKKSGVLTYEVRIIWPDKTVHWIKTFGNVIFNSQQEIAAIYGTVSDITQQKQTWIALTESERKLNLVIDASELGTFEIDLRTDDIIYTEKYLNIFGFTKADKPTRNQLLQRIVEEEKPNRAQAHAEAHRTGILSYETRIMLPDNSIRYIRIKGRILFDNNNKPARSLGTVLDITKEKTTLKKIEELVKQKTIDLEKNEERYHKMISDVTDYAILLMNNEGYIQSWNKGAEKIKGYTEEEIIGKNFKIFYLPEDQQTNLPERLLKEAAATGKTAIEGWRVRKDGTKFWGSVVITALYDDNRKVLGFTKVTRDLTERKLAEEELKRRAWELNKNNLELQAQKNFVDAILNSSIDSISVFDKDLNYIIVNAKCTEVYNKAKEELIGKKLTDVFPQMKGSKFIQMLSKAFTGELVVDYNYTSVIVNRHFETFFVPLKQNNEVYAVLAIAHDNTDIYEAVKKIELVNIELEEKKLQLERSNAELEQFAYIASHDLQEPLRKIQFFTDRLKKIFVDKDESANVFFEKIQKAAVRMSTLIKNLLDISRISHKVRFVPVDLNNVLADVKNDFELLIQQKNATIQIEELPMIEASQLQMEQLFYNLINNALKFCKKEGNCYIKILCTQLTQEELENYPRLVKTQTYYCITVQDTGIGFSQQYAEQIFIIFQRLNELSAYEGTGIGLAICKKIVTAHHGEIFATSNENEGAVFSVILPKKQITVK